MFTFCDVLQETKQKTQKKISRVRSTDWKLSLSDRGRVWEVDSTPPTVQHRAKHGLRANIAPTRVGNARDE